MSWPIDKLRQSGPWKAARDWRQLWRAEDLRRRSLQGIALPLPRGLVLEPTQRCNLSCLMCCHRQHHTEQNCRELDTAEALGLIRRLRSQNGFRSIGFIGSEPFVRDDLEQLMLVAVELGMAVSVQTNSTLLTPERIEIWAGQRGRVRSFGTSLEGPAGVDDRIRPGRDVFVRARRGIELAVRAGLPVTVSILILDQNREQLPELISLLGRMEVRSIDLSLVVNHGRPEVEETVRLSGLSSSEVCITTLPELEYRTSPEHLRQSLRGGLDLAGSMGMRASTSPEGFVGHFDAIRDGSIRRKRRLACGALDTVRVDPAGQLIHCQHFRRSFGDLNKVGLKEAWNSPELIEFRRRLAGNNLFPICVDCYRMRILPS